MGFCYLFLMVESNKNQQQKTMKKQDIVTRVNELAAIKDAKSLRKELAALIEEMKVSSAPTVKKVKWINIQSVDFDSEELSKVTIAPQVKTLYSLLQKQFKVNPVNLTEVNEFLDSNDAIQKLLNSRQNPKTVFAFYQGKMIELGLIVKEVKTN